MLAAGCWRIVIQTLQAAADPGAQLGKLSAKRLEGILTDTWERPSAVIPTVWRDTRAVVQAAAEPGAQLGGKLSAKRLEGILTSQLQAKEALISKLSAKANVAKVGLLCCSCAEV